MSTTAVTTPATRVALSEDVRQLLYRLVAVGAISADAAARSQYRTTRPSAARLAHL